MKPPLFLRLLLALATLLVIPATMAENVNDCLELSSSQTWGGFKNKCNFKIDLSFCVYKPDKDAWSAALSCEEQKIGGSWVGPMATSTDHTVGGVQVYWHACKYPETSVKAKFISGRGLEGVCSGGGAASTRPIASARLDAMLDDEGRPASKQKSKSSGSSRLDRMLDEEAQGGSRLDRLMQAEEQEEKDRQRAAAERQRAAEAAKRILAQQEAMAAEARKREEREELRRQRAEERAEREEEEAEQAQRRAESNRQMNAFVDMAANSFAQRIAGKSNSNAALALQMPGRNGSSYSSGSGGGSGGGSDCSQEDAQYASELNRVVSSNQNSICNLSRETARILRNWLPRFERCDSSGYRAGELKRQITVNENNAREFCADKASGSRTNYPSYNTAPYQNTIPTNRTDHSTPIGHGAQ